MSELVRPIPMSGIAHPLVDRVGESNGRRWSMTESRSPVVILGNWYLDLLQRCADKKRELVLATDETSALTQPFVEVWRGAGAHWLVREPLGGLRDGFTGRSLTEVGDLWGRGTNSDAAGPSSTSKRHHRTRSLDALELTAVVSVRMPARGSSPFGSTVSLLAEAVGDTPGAWGASEPALRAWDTDELTKAVRRRMPKPVQIMVRGRRISAVIRVRRTRHGVEETTHAALAAVGAEADLVAEATGRAAEALASIAGTAMPLVGLVVAQRGRSDLLRGPFVRPPATPVALLIGPPVAKHLGVSPDDERRRSGAELCGRPKLPGLLYRLSSEPDRPTLGWGALERVVEGFAPATRAGAAAALSQVVDTLRPPSL